MRLFKRLRAWWVATQPTSPEARFGDRSTVESEKYIRWLATASESTRTLGEVDFDGTGR